MLNEAAERAQEQACQQSINKAGNVSSIKQRLMLLPLVLLLAACSSPPTTLPTCSNALTNEWVIWLRLLTKQEPGD